MGKRETFILMSSPVRRLGLKNQNKLQANVKMARCLCFLVSD